MTDGHKDRTQRDGERDAGVEETMRAVKALLSAAAAIESVVATVLAEFDVTSSVAGVLWTLDPTTDAPTMREIATRLDCDPSTVSLAADKLESRGLIARRTHPADGRKRVLELTERGHALWSALSTRLHTALDLAGLTDEDRRTLRAAATVTSLQFAR